MSSVRSQSWRRRCTPCRFAMIGVPSAGAVRRFRNFAAWQGTVQAPSNTPAACEPVKNGTASLCRCGRMRASSPLKTESYLRASARLKILPCWFRVHNYNTACAPSGSRRARRTIRLLSQNPRDERRQKQSQSQTIGQRRQKQSQSQTIFREPFSQSRRVEEALLDLRYNTSAPSEILTTVPFIRVEGLLAIGILTTVCLAVSLACFIRSCASPRRARLPQRTSSGSLRSSRSKVQ